MALRPLRATNVWYEMQFGTDISNYCSFYSFSGAGVYDWKVCVNSGIFKYRKDCLHNSIVLCVIKITFGKIGVPIDSLFTCCSFCRKISCLAILQKSWKLAYAFLVPNQLVSSLPACRGTLSSLAVCLSVRLSVRHTLVFQTFLCSLLRYWLEIWYMNLLWHNTDKVWVSSRLTYFYRSYCPLLKFCFQDFSLQSFEILNWNLVYEFVMT